MEYGPVYENDPTHSDSFSVTLGGLRALLANRPHPDLGDGMNLSEALLHEDDPVLSIDVEHYASQWFSEFEDLAA